jgi:hypothetical protein
MFPFEPLKIRGCADLFHVRGSLRFWQLEILGRSDVSGARRHVHH